MVAWPVSFPQTQVVDLELMFELVWLSLCTQGSGKAVFPGSSSQTLLCPQSKERRLLRTWVGSVCTLREWRGLGTTWAVFRVSGGESPPLESNSRFQGKERRNRWQTLGIPISRHGVCGSLQLKPSGIRVSAILTG